MEVEVAVGVEVEVEVELLLSCRERERYGCGDGCGTGVVRVWYGCGTGGWVCTYEAGSCSIGATAPPTVWGDKVCHGAVGGVAKFAMVGWAG